MSPMEYNSYRSFSSIQYFKTKTTRECRYWLVFQTIVVKFDGIYMHCEIWLRRQFKWPWSQIADVKCLVHISRSPRRMFAMLALGWWCLSTYIIQDLRLLNFSIILHKQNTFHAEWCGLKPWRHARRLHTVHAFFCCVNRLGRYCTLNRNIVVRIHHVLVIPCSTVIRRETI